MSKVLNELIASFEDVHNLRDSVACAYELRAALPAVEAERKEFIEALEAYDAAADKFIGKVERGEARSKVTYSELWNACARSARVKEK